LLSSLAGPADSPDAVRVGAERISRAQLLEAASALAGRIVGANALAVHAEPSLTAVVAIVAGLLAGVPVVPVPPDAGEVERAHIRSDSGATLGVGVAGLESVPVDLSARAGTSLPEPAPQSTALILYTSGTTGPPKGVLLSRQALAADLDALAEAWAWTPDDLLVHGLPLFHVHGLVLGLLGPLRIGCRLIHTVRSRPEAYAAAAGSLYFAYRPSGPAWSMRRSARGRCDRPGCWCRAARRCPSRCFTGSPS